MEIVMLAFAIGVLVGVVVRPRDRDEALLDEIASKFGGSPDSAKKVACMMELFGRDWIRIDETLRKRDAYWRKG